MGKQLNLFEDHKVSPKYWEVPFVDEVQEFNDTFGKPNNYEPVIGEYLEWKFVYDFILEELEEYREACEKGDIVGILDALCDITYVSLGNGTLLHGLKGKIWKHIKKYKHQICLNHVKQKVRQKQLLLKDQKKKVILAIMKK